MKLSGLLKVPSSHPRESPAWLTLLVVCASVALVPLSVTGPSVALPDIAHEMHPSVQSLQWVINAYNLTFASFMLAFGALADRIGRRRVFRMGIGLFGAGALGCTLANEVVFLDIARAVAGIGAAATLTAGSTLLAARFEGRDRVRAFGFFGTALGAGLAFGPLLSGVLLSALGWRWVFAVPAVLGLLIALVSRTQQESRNPDARPIDRAGTVTFTLSLFLLVLALVEAPAVGWLSPLVIGCLIGFVVLLGGFVLVEHRQRAPMFDLDLLRYRRFVGVNATAIALAFTLLPLLVLLPTYFSAVEGFSAIHAGSVLLFFTAPTLLVPLLTAPLTRSISLRAQLTTAMVVILGGALWLMVLEPHVGLGTLAGPLIVTGIGYGLTLGVVDDAAVSSVELSRAGMASGMFNAVRLTADTAAAAIAGSLLISVTSAQLAGHVANPHSVADALDSGVHTTMPLAASALTTAVHVVFFLAAGAALINIPIALRTLKPSPEHRLLATSEDGTEDRSDEAVAAHEGGAREGGGR
jgi:MFS family permease